LPVFSGDWFAGRSCTFRNPSGVAVTIPGTSLLQIKTIKSKNDIRYNSLHETYVADRCIWFIGPWGPAAAMNIRMPDAGKHMPGGDLLRFRLV